MLWYDLRPPAVSPGLSGSSVIVYDWESSSRLSSWPVTVTVCGSSHLNTLFALSAAAANLMLAGLTAASPGSLLLRLTVTVAVGSLASCSVNVSVFPSPDASEVDREVFAMDGAALSSSVRPRRSSSTTWTTAVVESKAL